MEIILSGIGASLFQEAVNFVNAKIKGTSLDGRGAVIVSLLLAFLIAFFKVILSEKVATWTDIFTLTAQVWTVSQVWFLLIYEKWGKTAA